MKERGKDVKDMQERMPVILESGGKKPNYKKTSGALLTACRDYFRKDENEEAFQAWKARREGKAG